MTLTKEKLKSLYKNKPELRDISNQAQELLFNTGFDVEDLSK